MQGDPGHWSMAGHAVVLRIEPLRVSPHAGSHRWHLRPNLLTRACALRLPRPGVAGWWGVAACCLPMVPRRSRR